mgnify:CR=1 FL=1
MARNNKELYGFQPLAPDLFVGFLDEAQIEDLSATLMSRCTLVVLFMSSIIVCNTLSSR